MKSPKRIKIGCEGVILDGKPIEGVTDYVIQAHVDQKSGGVECRLDMTIVLEQSDFEVEL